ncbi:MAG: ATP-binding protein [Deltaproteobacteria bacterium]
MDAAATRTDRESLAQAFSLFEAASGALREEHARLHREVAELRREVEEKNVRLAQGLEEHRRWRLFLTEILDRMPNGIVVTDPSGAVVASNGAAERLMGLARSPEPGQPLERLSAVAAAVSTLAGRNGTDVVPVDGENGERRRLKVNVTPLTDPGGITGAVLLVLEDVTDERLLAERAERERRLASMGEMAARIAHEIRNPLTSCRLFHEMATRDVKDRREDGALRNLAKLEGVLGTIENTVSNMLGFLRNHRPDARSFDPEEALRACVEPVRPLLSERGIAIEVENRIPGERAVSDPSLLRQAFLNVLLNAVQAMRESERKHLKILLSRRPVRRGEREEAYLAFRFEDTGHGIPGDALHRVFDPFFTTRNDGTGLGLTVVQSILLALDGFAEVQSRVGEGTAVSLLVPQFRDPEGERP